jgi:hypothetical protein
MKELRNIFIFVGLMVFLAGCSRTFIVVPSGAINQGLLFSFFERKSDGQPSDYTIVELFVQRFDEQKNWVTIWELKGKKQLSFVKYGSSYSGLSQVVPPAKLQANSRYRVLVSEVSATNPKGLGGSEFLLDENGLVKVLR